MKKIFPHTLDLTASASGLKLGLQSTCRLGLVLMALCLEAAADEPQKAAPEVVGKPLFTELPPEQTGLNFVQKIAVEDVQSYLYNSGFACGGAAVGDVNGDGRPDVFLVSGHGDNGLYLNEGGMRFKKAGPGASVLEDSWVWGCGTAMADVDGDADLDIFVCNYDAPNRLWLNNGKGSFTDASAGAGVDFSGPSHTPYFYDLDGDGDLDLFLMTNRLFYPKGRPAGAASEIGPDGKHSVLPQFAPYFRVVQQESGDRESADPGKKPPPFLLEYGHPDRIYRNDGPDEKGIPRFKDVTSNSGIGETPGHGLSVLVLDVNGDGRPDIYVANDYTDADCLWINDGDFRFHNAVADYLPYTAFSSMGSDLGDFNGDGRFDFMVADMAGTTHFKAKTTMGEMTGYRRWVLENAWPRQAMRNMLYINSGAGLFSEVAFQAGVARSDWTWAVKFGDFDLDGRTDMVMTTGAARNFGDSDILVDPRKMVGRTEWEFYRNTPEGRQENLAFRGQAGLQFANVSADWGLDKNSMSYGAATGDLDGDGDLDLITTNLTDPVSIFQNNAAGGASHWLKVRLEGTKNRYGTGAVITVKMEDGSVQTRMMAPQTGFISSSEPVAQFGLGAAPRVAGITVQWPGRSGVQSLGAQKADQFLTIREADFPKPQGQPKPAPAAIPTLFSTLDPAKSGLNFQHKEKPWDDYQREFLLPAKLSQFGPGLAVGDVNRDGLDDLYCGGAAGQAGVLFLQQKDHTWKALENPPWESNAQSEDMGALFFDADRDGDIDLYIASGSNEWDLGDAHYADHLYLNHTQDGAVSFAEAPVGSLPDLRLSGSAVCGADFDRDGDVDLFIGSRSIPGQYPLTPDSVLLRNDSTTESVKFAETTDALAAGLKKSGLVTGALWSDADGNGWPDLLVTCEWGPVRLFLNENGKLTEATAAAGLMERTGWWNGLTGFDADGDGDMDYAVLNAGYNTKYGQPTAEKPLVLYRQDMDGNGVFDLVEAKCSAGGELPVRGRSCSSTAMPFIRDKFKTYKAFASSSLAGIYTDEKLGNATRVSAAELASGLLLNESKPGAPKFTWQALPSEAQYSPCFGAVATDLNGDNHPSLALAQNLSTREPETGLWRGSPGCLLTQNGKDGFAAVDHARSGFILPGDAKSLVACDIDGDGWLDLAASQNDGPLAVFRRIPATGTTALVVRLAGSPGNPSGLGAVVRLLSGGKAIAVREIYGGSGYLSQSTAAAAFTVPTKPGKLSIAIRWPSGRESTVPVPVLLKNPLICHEP